MFIENQSGNFEFLSLGCFGAKCELAWTNCKKTDLLPNHLAFFKAGITKDDPFTKSYLFKGT